MTTFNWRKCGNPRKNKPGWPVFGRRTELEASKIRVSANLSIPMCDLSKSPHRASDSLTVATIWRVWSTWFAVSASLYSTAKFISVRLRLHISLNTSYSHHCNLFFIRIKYLHFTVRKVLVSNELWGIRHRCIQAAVFRNHTDKRALEMFWTPRYWYRPRLNGTGFN